MRNNKHTHTNQLIRGTGDEPFHVRNSDTASSYFYVDLQATNLSSTQSVPRPLTLTYQQDVSFLPSAAEDYELSIQRFQLGTSSLPVWVPIIQPGNNTDRNLSIYSITMSYSAGGNDYNQQTFLEWIPQDLNAIVPQAPAFNSPQAQDNSTGYYNTLNVEWVVVLLQNTFNSCFNSLAAQVTAAGQTMPTIYAPVIIYDTNSTLLTIYVDQVAYDPTQTNDPIIIYFNSPMYGLIDSFLIEYLGPTSVGLGKNYHLVINSFNGTNVTLLPTVSSASVPSVALTQSTSTVSNWNPVESIIFTSNTLPIQSTTLLPAVVLFENVNVGANASTSNVANIITSFQTGNEFYRPYVSYQPSVYRWVSMYGKEQLKLFQINAYWRDNSGGLNNFLLASSQSFSMLVAFKRKNYY